MSKAPSDNSTGAFPSKDALGRRAGLSSLIANGWSWSIGWNPNYGGWYAQAWRYLPKPVRVRGMLKLKECVIEGGNSMEDAMLNLLQRRELWVQPSAP